MKKTLSTLVAVVVLTLAASPFAFAEIDAENIFKKKCSMCHKIDKKRMGPAVVKMSSDVSVLKDVITNGRKSMPKFGKKLSAEEIDAVVTFIVSKKPVAANPCAANPCAANPCAANPCAANPCAHK